MTIVYGIFLMFDAFLHTLFNQAKPIIYITRYRWWKKTFGWCTKTGNFKWICPSLVWIWKFNKKSDWLYL